MHARMLLLAILGVWRRQWVIQPRRSEARTAVPEKPRQQKPHDTAERKLEQGLEGTMAGGSTLSRIGFERYDNR
jgi:hypothetical protein